MARVKASVTATYTPAVLAGMGAFGGLFDAGALKSMGRARPRLVNRRGRDKDEGGRCTGAL